MTITVKMVTIREPLLDVDQRLKTQVWECIGIDLEAQGYATIEDLLTPNECQVLAKLYPRNSKFRSRVVMARHSVSRIRSGLRHTLGIIFHDTL